MGSSMNAKTNMRAAFRNKSRLAVADRTGKSGTYIFCILVFICHGLFAQDTIYRTPRWSLNASISGSENFDLYGAGGSVILGSRHLIGALAGIRPRAYPWETGTSPAGSLNYTYVFRDLGKKTFDGFVVTSVDYFSTRGSVAWYNIAITTKENMLYTQQLFWHAGIGVSATIIEHLNFNAALSYVLLSHISNRYTWTDLNGVSYEQKENTTDSEIFTNDSPLMFRMGVAWLFR